MKYIFVLWILTVRCFVSVLRSSTYANAFAL